MDQSFDIPTDASALMREAYHLVEAHLDAGAKFEAWCRASPVFARAAEEARLLRAYAPAQLRKPREVPRPSSMRLIEFPSPIVAESSSRQP